VAAQVMLLGAIAAAGVKGPRWPAQAKGLRLGAAALAAAGGSWLFAGAAAGLGRQLTPFPKPVEDGTIKRGGVYGSVRHPMYGGVLSLALAWALVSSPAALAPWAAAAAFLDAKRRREEAWLVEADPQYEEYRRSVRHSFLPYVW
jgi:protein-S-isoprenylcysteine O-methyltransferase Ste14